MMFYAHMSMYEGMFRDSLVFITHSSSGSFIKLRASYELQRTPARIQERAGAYNIYSGYKQSLFASEWLRKYPQTMGLRM